MKRPQNIPAGLAVACIATIAFASAASAGPTVQGLVGYWPLDEGKGDRADDVMHAAPDIFGNRAEAHILDPRWTRGRYGYALDCRGQTALTVSKTRDLDCIGQVTVSAWVRPEPKGRRMMIVNHEYAYRLALVKAGDGVRVQFQLNLDGRWAGNWITGRTVLKPGQWHFVAGVYDGATRRIYVDGRLDASESAAGVIGRGRNFTLAAAQVRGRRSRVGHARTYVLREALHGVIDEVRVWRRALSEETLRVAASENHAAVERQLGPVRALYGYVVRAVRGPGRDDPFLVALFNGGDQRYVGRAAVRVTGAKGESTAAVPLNVDSRGVQIVRVPSDGPPGTRTLEVRVGDRTVLSAPVYVMEPVKRARPGELRLRRVLVRDLSQHLGPDVFLDDGTSRVVRSPIGPYREAGPKKFARFAVRIPLQRTGLHLVRVRWPDDKPRVCEIATWSPAAADRFNCHSGYFTGDVHPVSNRMQTFEFVMWARDVRQVLVFTTWLDGRPAAAAAVEVFEVRGRLPAAPAASAPSERLIGHYWEDAQPLSRCFGGTSPGYNDFDRMTQNLCDYFDYTGQNLLMHPLVWYEGPIYNSLVEARGGKGGFYFPTDGWVDILLDRFEERGFRFVALLNVHQLPSLVRDMNADIARIRSGEPTYNTVSGNNEVFVRTWHHRLPMFNALHPEVQERVLALIREMADRYGDSPAFAGVGFHLTVASMLQPGSLDVSYDDWTVREFEKDTGVTAPVPARASDRFRRRFLWIKEHARDRWIAWRCRRVAQFYARAADVLRRKRPDLKLVVSVLEPPMSIIDPQREQWLNGTPQVELSREAGIDPALLARIPNLVIMKRMGPTARVKRLTFGLDRPRWGASAPATLASVRAIRDMDLDPHLTEQYRTTPEFGVFLYNRYFESDVGRKRPMTCDWYGGIGWRATAVVPSGMHFMEYYAQAMRLFDPNMLTIGGFTNGTVGHEADVEHFARIYRRLPVGEWETVTPGGKSDAPIVRRCVRDGEVWVYAVNPGSGLQTIELPLLVEPEPVAGSPAPVDKGGRKFVTLGPYAIAAWKARVRAP